MANDDNDDLDRAALATLEEEERRREKSATNEPTLDEEIVRRWSPERLKRLVVRGAGRGERLDLSTRTEMDRLLPGHDFSDVRVFRGVLAEEVTRRHNADAVTIGRTGMILVRDSSRSAPGTAAGRALLAHELTHVAQARQGMVFAKEGGGEGEHEKEAEAVEASALEGASAQSGSNSIEQEQAKRKRVMERAIEIWRTELEIGLERGGR